MSSKGGRKRKSKIEKETNSKVQKINDGTTSKYFEKPDEANRVDKEKDSESTSLIKTPNKRLGKEFYEQTCLDLSKALIGMILVRKLESGERISGIIVETEAYTGPGDDASHSAKGRTERTAAMFMDPGTSYVYNIYGSYCCMNISSQVDGAAVLLRALDPVEGVDKMRTFRDKAKKDKAKNSKPLAIKELCNGPSKFCMALNISKSEINQVDMINSDAIWLEKGVEVNDCDIVVSTRIGIDGAGKEAASKPWRFYLRGNQSVSKRDKKAEAGVEND